MSAEEARSHVCPRFIRGFFNFTVGSRPRPEGNPLPRVYHWECQEEVNHDDACTLLTTCTSVQRISGACRCARTLLLQHQGAVYDDRQAGHTHTNTHTLSHEGRPR